MRMWAESIVLYFFLAAEAALFLQASTEPTQASQPMLSPHLAPAGNPARGRDAPGVIAAPPGASLRLPNRNTGGDYMTRRPRGRNSEE
jgi:hypothetical protein